MPAAWPFLSTRLSLRRRFAALGLVGALMVLLPLVQVLRYQVQALDVARAQLQAMDPVLLAVAAQRSLLVHQPLASQVLAGQTQQEPQRLHVQTEVDEGVFRLDVALTVHGAPLAIGESQALRQDWHTLARQVQARELSVPASESAHRLLVEQLLQVVDLVTLGAHWRDEEAATQALAQAAQRILPRLAAELAALPAPAPEVAAAHATTDAFTDAGTAPAAALQRLQRHFEHLEQAAAPGRHSGSAPLRAASDALAAQAQRGAQAVRSWATAADAAALSRAQAELLTVHAALQPQLQAALVPRLQARVQRLQREPLWTTGLAALLALAGGLLLHSVWPQPAPVRNVPVTHPRTTRLTLPAEPAADPAKPAARPPAGPAGRAETGALLERLRGVPRTRPAELPSPTLPPAD